MIIWPQLWREWKLSEFLSFKFIISLLTLPDQHAPDANDDEVPNHVHDVRDVCGVYDRVHAYHDDDHDGDEHDHVHVHARDDVHDLRCRNFFSIKFNKIMWLLSDSKFTLETQTSKPQNI